MKNSISLLVILSIFFSCKLPKITAPTFVNLGQWQISKFSGTQVTLSNNANFYNPNNIDGLKVNNVNIEVMTDNRKIGVISNNGNGITIPKQAEFSVPLSLTVDIKDLIGNLTSIISVVTGSSIDLRVVGDVNVGYSIISKTIRVDQSIPISISDIKNKTK